MSTSAKSEHSDSGNSTSVARARDAWFAGDDRGTLAILADDAPQRSRADRVEAGFLGARAHLRSGDGEAALAALKAIERELDEGDERLLHRVLAGAATYRSGSVEKGLGMLREAATGPDDDGHEPVRSEAAYELARALWSERNLDEAERVLDDAVDEATDVIHARILALIGEIEVTRERYPIAARHFSDALGALKRATHADAALHASLLRSLTTIARETLDLRLARRLRRDVDAMAWTQPLASARFHVTENLAWIAMLEGDLTEAWRLFDENLVAAPDDMFGVRARAGLSALLRIAGDRFGPSRNLERLRALMNRATWDSADNEGRMILLEAAMEATRLQAHDPKGARGYLETASDALAHYSRTTKRSASVAQEDRRLEAVAVHTEGLLVAARNDLRTATHQLERASRLWRDLGYRMREAQAALDLFTTTSDERHLDAAESATRMIPDSWLRRDLDALRHGAANRARHLTPAERRVMFAICEGKTSKQIAEEFGRSENTIRNQTKRVFSTMHVNTRASLVAECARVGLLPKNV